MLYAASGAINVTVVDGTTWTGLYATDGSWNVVVSDGSAFVGAYHPCGALNVTAGDGSERARTAPDGSLYVSESPGTYALYIAVVSGSLGGGETYFRLMETGDYVLMESGDKILLEAAP